LNADPKLPFDDASFAGAMCAVSVQYMIRPVEIFSQVARVLEPGAPFVVSFSNRCFPTKAVAAWLAGSDSQHIDLVREYFRRSGGWGEIGVSRHMPEWDDPLYAVWARRQTTLIY
jgi:ubiquinone/menaquinone biosynthesis C-methylase UbiE